VESQGLGLSRERGLLCGSQNPAALDAGYVGLPDVLDLLEIAGAARTSLQPVHLPILLPTAWPDSSNGGAVAAASRQSSLQEACQALGRVAVCAIRKRIIHQRRRGCKVTN